MSEIEPILNPPAPPAGTADGATRMQNFIERVKVPQATRASIAVLLAMFLCGASSTEFVAHVALVPGRTIQYVWNVFTASFFNTSLVMVSTLRCRGTPAPCCSNMRKG